MTGSGSATMEEWRTAARCGSGRKPLFGRRWLFAAASLIATWWDDPGFAETSTADVPPAAPVLRLRSGLLALARAGWPLSPAELRPLVVEAFDLPDITAAAVSYSCGWSAPVPGGSVA